MTPRRHIRTRALPRIAAELVIVAGLAGANAALGADATASKSAARPATAQATAFTRDNGDGNPHGFVTVSGHGSRSGRGTTATASTAGYKGSAGASARVNKVSLLNGMVRADLATVRANATGSRADKRGRVTNLVVAGDPKGDFGARAVYDLPGYGTLVVLNDSGPGITGLTIKLARQYGAYPEGTTLRVAYAEAAAKDGMAPPPTTPTTPAKPSKPSKPSKPAKPHTPAATTPAKPAPNPKKPARRKPPRTRALLTAKGFVFPVYGKHNYTDTFGAPRADTGIHEGNDIFAAAGTPLVAVCDGSLNRVGTLPISGNRLWVKCTTGDSFFYAHLSAYASDAQNGLRVKAGQVIGFLGSTGDAEHTPPHLHFEVHPGDGAAVDPYPFLRAWENHRDVPAAAWVRANGQVGEQQPGTLVVVRDFLSR